MNSKKTTSFLRNLLPVALVTGLATTSHGQTPTALETAAETAIEGLATSAGTLLIAALAVVIAFAVFKVVKRAVGRA